jgi:ribokinase
MRAFVAGNVTVDETIAVTNLPLSGESILGQAAGFDLGGKGANQAVLLARCGLDTTLIAGVADDARGHIIRTMLEREEGLTCGLIEQKGGVSDVSLILVQPNGDNVIVTTTDAADRLTGAAVIEALSSAAPGDLLVLQGNLSAMATREVLQFARRTGMRTAVNPSPVRSYFNELWSLIDILFLNEGEAEALAGGRTMTSLAALLETGVDQVVMTLGARGAVLKDEHQEVTVPAAAARVVDTTGAGDTFLSVALAFSKDRNFILNRQSLEIAVEAAAMTVSRKGTLSAFPSVSDLHALLNRGRHI